MTTAITEYSKTDAALADLAGRFKGVVFDVKDPKGMQEARHARAELRNYRVDLEKVRVEIKAPALERCRLIDAEAKRITAALVELEDPIDATIKVEEKRKEREAQERAEAERQRVAGLRAQIEAIRRLPTACVGKTSWQIMTALNAARGTAIGPGFAELSGEAEEALAASVAQIAEMLSSTQAQEAEAERVKAEREELARQQAEQAERERAGREALQAEERASRARIAEEERAAKAVRDAQEAALRQESDRLAAEKKDAEDRERTLAHREAALKTVAGTPLPPANEMIDPAAVAAVVASVAAEDMDVDEFVELKGLVENLRAAMPPMKEHQSQLVGLYMLAALRLGRGDATFHRCIDDFYEPPKTLQSVK